VKEDHVPKVTTDTRTGPTRRLRPSPLAVGAGGGRVAAAPAAGRGGKGDGAAAAGCLRPPERTGAAGRAGGQEEPRAAPGGRLMASRPKLWSAVLWAACGGAALLGVSASRPWWD